MQKFVKDFSEVQNLTEEKERFSFLKLRLINTHVRVFLTDEEKQFDTVFYSPFHITSEKSTKIRVY